MVAPILTETFLTTIFSQACAAIQEEYSRLGYQLGWRFLASPRSTLNRNTPIALITLNPGGSVDRPDHGRESSEAGSAYVVETWPQGGRPGRAPLQTQVRRLFAELADVQGRERSGDDLLHRSLAAYFVPFRLPTFKSLTCSRDALAFASKLWAGLFRQIDPKLIITIDHETSQRLTQILGEQFGIAPVTRRFPTGWGAYNAELVAFESGDIRRMILRFPHLSRFGIFGRPESKLHVERIMEAVAGIR